MPIEFSRKKLKNYSFKAIFILFLFVFFVNKLTSQMCFHRQFMEECSKARSLFKNGEYGSALRLSNEAKEKRKEILQNERKLLLQAFKNVSYNFEKLGISELENKLLKKNENASLCILREYLEKYGADKFENSPTALLDFITSLEAFPEADFLIGEIYKIEGEYQLASVFYLEAYKNAEYLDIPSELYDILYALADTALLMEDYENYEKYLLLVVEMGESYKDKALVKAMRRSLKNGRTGCLEKFFSLYRSHDFRQIRAFCELASYYGSKGEGNRELCMVSLAAVASFTRIYEIIDERSVSKTHGGFESVLCSSKDYPDVIDWGSDNGLWKSFHLFALSCLKNKAETFTIGKEMIEILSKSSPVAHWKTAADLVMQTYSD